ncbi:MAG TPA: hypothetical protein PLG99_05460 [Kaistiaceae bacterium]|nr:hypothetical protein [Kaistiaceae bacterium]
MPAFIVTYDLRQHGQNYDCITKRLESYPTHWHMQQSVWIINTEKSAKEIRDHLTACLDANDKLFVGRLSGQAAWKGYEDSASQWLMSTL